jgi:hypothetical protein
MVQNPRKLSDDPRGQARKQLRHLSRLHRAQPLILADENYLIKASERVYKINLGNPAPQRLSTIRKHMPIANVQEEGSWIKVYDESSRRISQMSSNGITVVGIASDFFVTEENSWIKTYDKDCKRIAQMSSNNVEVSGAAGGTFTTKEGSWIKTYDQHCKRISQRSA